MSSRSGSSSSGEGARGQLPSPVTQGGTPDSIVNVLLLVCLMLLLFIVAGAFTYWFMKRRKKRKMQEQAESQAQVETTIQATRAVQQQSGSGGPSSGGSDLSHSQRSTGVDGRRRGSGTGFSNNGNAGSPSYEGTSQHGRHATPPSPSAGSRQGSAFTAAIMEGSGSRSRTAMQGRPAGSDRGNSLLGRLGGGSGQSHQRPPATPRGGSGNTGSSGDGGAPLAPLNASYNSVGSHSLIGMEGLSHDPEIRKQQLVMSGKFAKLKLIGRGQSGTVYQVLLDDGSTIALKELLLNPREMEQQLKEVETEIKLINEVNDPSIVRYYGALCDKKDLKLQLFMELVGGGSLADLVREMDNPLPEATARQYVLQITRGLAAIHKVGVVHRDLKGDNILLDTSGHVKIADFGTAKMIGITSGASQAAQTLVGTPYFMAPEVLAPVTMDDSQQQGEDDDGYGTRADIWSLGITVCELLNKGNPPWPSFPNPGAAFIHISNEDSYPIIPEGLSPECKDFVNQCCVRDPRKRGRAAKLLQHPWLRGQRLSSNQGEAIDYTLKSPQTKKKGSTPILSNLVSASEVSAQQVSAAGAKCEDGDNPLLDPTKGSSNDTVLTNLRVSTASSSNASSLPQPHGVVGRTVAESGISENNPRPPFQRQSTLGQTGDLPAFDEIEERQATLADNPNADSTSGGYFVPVQNNIRRSGEYPESEQI